MTTNVELLPLPGWAHKADKLLCDTDWLRTQVSDYARANMEPLIAEIEALRAEREVIVAEAVKYADKSGRLEARAERLAEALRLAMDWNWLDEDARPSRTAEICDAALDPTSAQEDGRD